MEYVLEDEVERSGAHDGMLLWAEDVGEVGGRTLSWERRSLRDTNMLRLYSDEKRRTTIPGGASAIPLTPPISLFGERSWSSNSPRT